MNTNADPIIRTLDRGFQGGQKCGLPTEIWSRVCGYHRPVKKWNKGKQEEWNDRKEYILKPEKGEQS